MIKKVLTIAVMACGMAFAYADGATDCCKDKECPKKCKGKENVELCTCADLAASECGKKCCEKGNGCPKKEKQPA